MDHCPESIGRSLQAAKANVADVSLLMISLKEID
jgi:hypothetical protein